jgi:DNA-binding NarL/FixJ family response regulator
MVKIEGVIDGSAFLQTIQILSHYLSIRALHTGNEKSDLWSEGVSLEMTPRRILIASLLSKGWENRRIAEELSFSESLIRKETMAIFKFYGISTREEMLAIHV